MCLAGCVAVHALLVAVPLAVRGHRAHHEVEPVWGPHERGVFAKRDVVDVLVGQLAPRHLRKRFHDGVDVVHEELLADERVHLAHGLAGRFLDSPHVGIRYRAAAIAIDLADELDEQDGPRCVHGYHVLSVDDGNACADVVCIRAIGGFARRHEMDAHRTWPFGVERAVVHLVEMVPRVFAHAFLYVHCSSYPFSAAFPLIEL